MARAGGLVRSYVFRLDRLTRSGIRDTLEVVHELRAHGCELRTVADGFDVNGPASDVVLAVMAWAAQMERLATNERIAAARIRVEAEGGRWGRPSGLTKLELGRAAKMRASGKTLREVSAALNIPRSTLSDALTGKVWAGRAPKTPDERGDPGLTG